MFDPKPYSEACEQNKLAIAEVLGPRLQGAQTLLEIGSGTGQHAVYFAARWPRLQWQTSDVAAHLPGIRAWLAEARGDNLPPPLCLDVTGEWPDGPFDAAFSANTAHIMGAPEVVQMLAGIGRVLAPGGRFFLYGPFNEGGRYTSESNAAFDDWLHARDPRSGIKDLTDLSNWAGDAGLVLEEALAMPANNQTLVWRRP